MKTKMVHHALFLLAAAAAAAATFHVASSSGTPTPSQPLSAAAREFLAAHNQARAAVGVEPLKWSEQMANVTDKLVRNQRNSLGCQFANLTAGKYGANQLLARGVAVRPRMVVEEWVKQKQFYNHTDNTCAPNHRCGVYTQVVWRKSLQLGCSQASCDKDDSSLTICFYNPPGNYVGESPY